MATNDNNNDDSNHIGVLNNSSTVVLDEDYYYYQNPKTGQVSATPLSTRQLIKLLVPVRDNNVQLHPILPSTTQVLKVAVPPPAAAASAAANEDQSQHQGEDTSSSSSSFGKWTSVSDIDILKEASCQQWYLTVTSPSSSTSSSTSNQSPEGPCSCRKLVKIVEDAKRKQREGGQASILVFAQKITPEWTDESKLPNLQLVLAALQDQQKQQQQHQHHLQTVQDNVAVGGDNEKDQDQQQHSKQVQDELEAFLRSTEDDDGQNDGDDNEDDDGGENSAENNLPTNTGSNDKHVFEADDGMRYIRDPMTGNWIHEGLAPTAQQSESTAKAAGDGDTTKNKNQNINNANQQQTKKKKKKKKSQFSKRNAKQWVYISGLPTDDDMIDVGDVQRYFSKAGMLDLDPETLQPKIKLYRDRSTQKLKGDASVCYARPESVELALQILDDSLWDEHHRVKVERAHFEAKNSDNGSGSGDGQNDSSDSSNNKKRKIEHHKRRPVSEAQRKVARLALLQAQDDGFGERLAGGRKGLRIIVIKGIMDGISDDKLEETLYEICKEYGDIEKITCMSRTQVVIVKFVEPLAASSAVEALNGSTNSRATTNGGNSKNKIEAIYWDGVTDYTTLPGDDLKEREDEDKRHDDFGNWLDSQEELPQELQLQVAADD